MNGESCSCGAWLLIFAAVCVLVVPGTARAGLLPSDTPPFPYQESDSFTIERNHSQSVFEPGEKIKMGVNYLGITTGYITVKVLDKTVEGRRLYELRMKATTKGLVDWLYEIRSRAVSYMDARGLYSWGMDYAFKSNDEHDTDVVRFNQEKRFWVLNKNKKKSMAPYTQDALSAIYYLRTLELKKGESYEFPVQVSDKNYRVIVKVDKKERIATKNGWKDALRVTPTLSSDTKLRQAREHLKDESTGVHIWLSDDRHKIPLRISVPAAFGSVWGYIDSFRPR